MLPTYTPKRPQKIPSLHDTSQTAIRTSPPKMPPTELTTLPTHPSASDFIPLSDHQAQTPTTFFGGKPVLHAEFSGCDLLIRTRDAEREEFVGFNTGSGGVESGEEEGDGVGGMRVVSGVNGFVTSE